MAINRKAMMLLEVLKQLRDDGIRLAKNDHQVETFRRAFQYASRRVIAGQARNLGEARHSFSAFGDGFCTGVHRANGTRCEENFPYPLEKR